MRLHYRKSSHENATPSNGTSLLASCKGVTTPHHHPRGESWQRCAESQLNGTHSNKGLDVPKWKSLDIPGIQLYQATQLLMILTSQKGPI